MVAGHLTIMFGLRGPSISIATACTSGVHNIGQAARIIAYGDAMRWLRRCGKSQYPAGRGWLCSARSTRNDNPQAASRPWDKDRDGFVLGDGAAWSCWKSTSTRKNAVRKSMLKSSALV
jgi:3-oxoacyl-[acyl-carrier-protein] synthase II